MTRTQIDYLKALGYEDTQEDGAILEFKKMGTDGFVWKDQTFINVLSEFSKNYERGYMRRLAHRIIIEI